MIADITPIAEISQRAGLPIECCTFIGSSPIRQYAEGWTLDQLLQADRGGDHVRGRGRAAGDVRHRGHDARRSRDAARALFDARSAPARSASASPTPSATRRRAGAAAVVRFVAQVVEECGGGVGIDWHGHRDRDLAVDQHASRRSRPARRACTAPRSASASASATRRWTCCW